MNGRGVKVMGHNKRIRGGSSKMSGKAKRRGEETRGEERKGTDCDLMRCGESGVEGRRKRDRAKEWREEDEI